MTDRERLLQILNVPIYPHENVDPLEAVADYLLDNGVTFQKWIPVTERLPENDEVVLILCKIGKMFVGFRKQLYSKRYVWQILTARDSTKEITQIVTHWMPLPEPPKEET